MFLVAVPKGSPKSKNEKKCFKNAFQDLSRKLPQTVKMKRNASKMLFKICPESFPKR